MDCAKVDVRTHFWKGSKGRELAVHHFSTERFRSIQQRPLSHVAWSCRTTRHCPFLSPAMLPLTLFLNHPRKAKPTMNGLTQRICKLTSSLTNCCAPHRHRGATESPCLWQSTAASVTSFAMTRLPPACHTLEYATAVLLARSSRIVRHDGARLHLARRLETRCLRCLPAEVTRQGRSAPSQQALLRQVAFGVLRDDSLELFVAVRMI